MIYIATQAYTRILLCGTVVCTLCIRQAMLWTMQHYASCCLTFTHVEQSLKLLYKSLKGNGSHTFLSLYTVTHSRAWYQCLVFSAKPLPRVWLCACSICVTLFLIFSLLLNCVWFFMNGLPEAWSLSSLCTYDCHHFVVSTKGFICSFTSKMYSLHLVLSCF